jgi:hypothetical protein
MATKYTGDVWELPWYDLYSSQVVALYKIGAGDWVQIANDIDNGIDGDNYSGQYDWTINLVEDSDAVSLRIADKDLWDAENPDDGEYVDYGPFDIELRVIDSIVVSPVSTRVKILLQKQFTAVAYDQTGTALDTQPEFAWTTDSIHGEINAQGLFTAGDTEEECTVTATSGAVSGEAAVSVLEKLYRPVSFGLNLFGL